MVNLRQIIQCVHPVAIERLDFEITWDGVNYALSKWNTAKLGSQPSSEQITDWLEAPPQEILVKDLQAKIAQRRWEVENAGIVIPSPDGPLNIATDDRSKFLLKSAADEARDKGMAAIWKITPELWVSLSPEQLLFIKETVDGHIRACFSREKELYELLAATPEGERKGLVSIIEKFWVEE